MRPAPITADDLDAWRENGVTQFVMGALARMADAQRTAWAQLLDDGAMDEVELANLRITLATRADTFRAIAETNYARLCEVMEVQER